MLQRSTWSGLVLSAAVVSASFLMGSQPAWAQEAPPAAPAAAASGSVNAAKLKSLADDFMHYSLVNNAELAKANAQAILDANAAPADLVAAFEAAANGRDARQIMINNQKREDIRDVSAKLLDKLEEGYRAVARDPVRIRADIDRLANGPRAYNNARDHLVAAGQFAAPIFIEYLQNSQKKDVQPFILRVIVESGRPMVLPLVEELNVSDPALKVTVVNLLGQIGYRQALPALKSIQSSENLDAQLKTAVDGAIASIDRAGSTAKASAAELYLDSAENYYSRKPSYQPLLPTEKTNPVWSFDKGLNNVSAVAVPTNIWNTVMAGRNAGSALKLDTNNAKAISLWLASQMKKEILLAGAADPSQPAGSFDAGYVALASGPVYVNPVLSRALDTHDVPLALRAINVLEQTGGTSGLVSSSAGSPLVRALAFPDRSVRFHAAFALARANPADPFPSHFRVVPVLAEAISSTGTPSALVINPNDDLRNKMADTLRNGNSHYTVYTGATLSAALEQAHRAPAFNVVIVANGPEVSHIGDAARTDYRLTGAPILIATPAANIVTIKAQGMTGVDEAGDDAAVAAALASARNDAGNGPLDVEKATSFATTAIDLLGSLANDHKSIYNVNDAVPTLIEALKDKRTDIALGAAKVLGKLKNNEAQKALGGSSLSPDVDPAVRGPFFHALADSARHTGNVLDSAAINALIKVVATEPDTTIRNEAAGALGALNVPTNQASTLILQQLAK